MLQSLQFNLLTFSKRFIPLTKRFNSNAKTSTILDDRLEFYDKMADNWWEPFGPMKHLHIIHAPRMSFICDQLKNKSVTSGSQLLSGLNVVDVGCGVGFVSEDLAKLGASVTGLDPSKNAIKVAKMHAESYNNITGRLEYLHTTVEDHANLKKEFYDVAVVCLVLEQIQNREEFIKCCLSLVKPKGSFIIMHTNRTIAFYFLAMYHMHVTGIYPKKVIKHNRVLKKDEVVNMIIKENWDLIGQSGINFPWVGLNAHLTPSESQASILHFTKK